MLKTLIKKQLQMMLTAFYRAGKNKKQKSKAGYLVYAVLMLYVGGVIFFLFYSMMSTLCAPLVNSGLGWLYFFAGRCFVGCSGSNRQRIYDAIHAI